MPSGRRLLEAMGAEECCSPQDGYPDGYAQECGDGICAFSKSDKCDPSHPLRDAGYCNLFGKPMCRQCGTGKEPCPEISGVSLMTQPCQGTDTFRKVLAAKNVEYVDSSIAAAAIGKGGGERAMLSYLYCSPVATGFYVATLIPLNPPYDDFTESIKVGQDSQFWCEPGDGGCEQTVDTGINYYTTTPANPRYDVVYEAYVWIIQSSNVERVARRMKITSVF